MSEEQRVSAELIESLLDRLLFEVEASIKPDKPNKEWNEDDNRRLRAFVDVARSRAHIRQALAR